MSFKKIPFPIINKCDFYSLNLASHMNVNWNLFKTNFRGGGCVFQRGDNFCIGHLSFKCVWFFAFKSENEKLDTPPPTPSISVFWGFGIKDASSVYTVNCLQILGDVIMTVKEFVCLDVSSSLTSLSLTNSLSL